MKKKILLIGILLTIFSFNLFSAERMQMQEKYDKNFFEFEALGKQLEKATPQEAIEIINILDTKYDIDIYKKSGELLTDPTIITRGKTFIPNKQMQSEFLQKIRGLKDDEKVACLIQFKEKPSLNDIKKLYELNGQYLDEINDFTGIWIFTAKSINLIVKLDILNWIGKYDKNKKMNEEEILRLNDAYESKYKIYSYNGDQNEYRNALSDLGIYIIYYDETMDMYFVETSPSIAKETLNYYWVKKVLPLRKAINEGLSEELNFNAVDSRIIVNSKYINNLGNTGEDVLVGVNDTGLWDNHDDFPDDAVEYSDPEPSDGGHGTHVSGIIASRGVQLEGAKGVAPGSKLYVKSGNYNPAINEFNNNNVHVMNYSRTCDGTYNYNDYTEDFDEYIREDKICIIKSAGNSQNPKTITNPGTAKNIITIGALSYTINGDVFIGDRADYSSQGATSQDGRLKPDVVAPGGNAVAEFYSYPGEPDRFSGYKYGVISCRAQDNAGNWLDIAFQPDQYYDPWYPPGQVNTSWYTRSCGTSMAAPHVTGIAAMFYKEYYDNNNFTQDGLCPRDFRAFLVADAIPLAGDDYGGSWDVNSDNAKRGYANTKVGFGLVDALHSIYDVSDEVYTALWAHGGIVETLVPEQDWDVDIPNHNNAERIIFVLSYEDEEGWNDEPDTCLKHNLEMEVEGLGKWSDLLPFGDQGNQVTNEDPLEKVVDESPNSSYHITISGEFNTWWLPFESQRYTICVVVHYKDPELALDVPNTNITVGQGQSFSIPFIAENTGGMTAAGVTAVVEYISGPGNHSIDDFIGTDQHQRIFVGNLVGENDWELKSINLTAKNSLDYGTYTLRLKLEGINKGLDGSNEVNITVEVQQYSSIDVALVLDRSGSMGGNKIYQAKNAATQFVQLLNIGDEVAVCSYSGSASTNFMITEVTGQQTINDAVAAISVISAGGMTSIGAGMEEGRDQLDNATVKNYPQGMLLLSDGRENTSPMVVNVLPTIPAETDIYTIGFGSGCDEDLMENIATTTGGFYRFAYDDGSNISVICHEIWNAISGQQIIAGFSGSIAGGGREVIEHNVVLDSLCSQVTFNLMWEHNDSDLDLVLIDPNNIEIDSAYAASDTTIYFYSYETQEFYRIDEPDYGDWTLRIIGVTVPYGTEDYDVTVAGFSGIEMQVAFDQDSYITGQPIVITAELTVEGNSITGATVTTEVENPNFIIDSLTLYDDGNHEDGVADDGIYGNSYNNTNQGGSYTFTIFASGTAPVGGDFTRIASRSTFVSGPTVYQTTIDAGYNMVAVPGIPTPSDPVSIFGDDIIPFYINTNNSNIWWWSEINSSYWIPDEIENGYGYWLKAWEDNTIIDAQVSPVTMPVTIPLTNSAAYYVMQHGWHMLGNPFNYQIDYGDNNFNISADVSPWCYIWENGHYNLYLFDNTKSINPWQAFWVHTNANNEEVEMFLSIKEEGLQSDIVSTLSKDNKSREITNWEIQFLVSVSDMEDISNYAGINENASDDWDVMDVPEIGSPNPDYVSLYFPHDDWGQYSADYTRNVRSPSLEDNEWYFIVKSTESGEAQLTWNIPDEVPEDYQLEITDLENGNTTNIEETSEYIFNITANNEYEFVFTVVTYGVGPEPDIPTIFGLSTNYPNPFSLSTKIKYQLPERADVDISIYNIKGQKIITLISKEIDAGYYDTTWDGKDNNGNYLSSGIYFYRLETEKFKETKKVLFIR